MSPGWASTDLGQALVTAAEAIEDDEVNDGQQAAVHRRVVLISDLQQGSNLDALLAYEWPERTELVVKAIPCEGDQRVAAIGDESRLPGPSRRDDLPSIRITNSPDAIRIVSNCTGAMARRSSQRARNDRAGDYGCVRPGGSEHRRPCPGQAGPAATAKLILTGDDHDFDNTLYVMPRCAGR